MSATPATLAELLSEMRQCLVLKGENPFKIRAFEKAEGVLAGRDDVAERARTGTLLELDGIGKGIAAVVTEWVKTGRSKELEELQASIPPALREFTRIPGLGPKKAQALIDELGIETLGELEYACRENRLQGLKGFGEKAQAKILEGVQFLMAARERLRWVDAKAQDEAARVFLAGALKGVTGARLEPAGEFRRRLEVVSGLDYLVGLPSGPAGAKAREAVEHAVAEFRKAQPEALPLRMHFAGEADFGSAWAKATASPEHWKALGAPKAEAASEEDFYRSLGLPWIAPEMRETGEEVALARTGRLATVLPWDGIQGVFHNHTVASDGAATLEEMVAEASRLGLKYIGISDHSQSAFYAQGLKEEALEKQHQEVKRVQKKYPGVRIFWGVESDILQDGSLDYPDAVLARMDFVIASIHSRFQMDREAMTERLLKAVRNPRTTMLGHLTGRLLLGRKGYDFDFEKVFAECAKRGVVVEINAHPQRLDVDWRWGKRLRELGVRVSVNPDAHELAGLQDVVHGVNVARKALLPAAQVVNTRDVAGVERWLAQRI
ncbi:MAG: PHP domain-containing protein [Bdellovibrionales bacterium]|nr:PHP domain-containing protein [Bdellovibrionales bacterium]